MKISNKKDQNDPTKEEIKFILELLNSNKLNEAKKEIDKQITKYVNSSILFNIFGALFAAQNQLNNAIKNYQKAIKINPSYAQAYNNLGVALQKLNKLDDAIFQYNKAINLKNDFPEAYNNLGNAYLDLNKPENSIEYFAKALSVKPDFADAYNNLGATYEKIGKTNEAIENYKKAIKAKPDFADAYNNLGTLFSDVARFDESMLNYKKAIELSPNNEKYYNNLGTLLNTLGKYDEATTEFNRAIKIKPDYVLAYSNHIFNLNYITNLDKNLYLSEAKKFGLNCKTIKKDFLAQYQYEKEPKKLKLGFVSSDFGNHPGGFFTLSTLRELKKKNFDLIAYSAYDRKDDFSPHFRPLFLKWHSIEKMKDDEVVEQIFKDGIHILIEAQGHSAKNRIPIFMYKAAPIQLSWLSTGTLGVAEIDYLIGSPHMTPQDEENHFVEKIWRLPEITQCFTPPDFDVKIKSLPASRNHFITFGCVNKLAKVNDDVVALWSKILSSIPNSKLLLKNRDFDSQKIVENTLARFEKHKIKNHRLILKGKSQTRKELLEIYNEIDIALDPFPFQGNTCTCESVWMGVPVITLKGDRYIFHTGESINANLNMHDWIAKTYEEYVSKAIKFSSDIDLLSKIRKTLRETALQSPVFDSPRFAEHFSKMLWDMWRKFIKKSTKLEQL